LQLCGEVGEYLELGLIVLRLYFLSSIPLASVKIAIFLLPRTTKIGHSIGSSWLAHLFA
jgi:hypothetical protein